MVLEPQVSRSILVSNILISSSINISFHLKIYIQIIFQVKIVCRSLVKLCVSIYHNTFSITNINFMAKRMYTKAVVCLVIMLDYLTFSWRKYQCNWSWAPFCSTLYFLFSCTSLFSGLLYFLSYLSTLYFSFVSSTVFQNSLDIICRPFSEAMSLIRL